MKYYLDTEFIEEPGRIELISIGIVAEDGREYYAVNMGFDFINAWRRVDSGVHWVRENVLQPIHWQLSDRQVHHGLDYEEWRENILKGKPYEGNRLRNSLGRLISEWGHDLYRIRKDILSFVGYPNYEPKNEYMRDFVSDRTPKFYGYYSDYDWVIFCWIFGKMIDLPSGFPMYCIDTKQMLDERGLSKEWVRDNCPPKITDHIAIDDARWIYSLHKEIQLFDVQNKS